MLKKYIETRSGKSDEETEIVGELQGEYDEELSVLWELQA